MKQEEEKKSKKNLVLIIIIILLAITNGITLYLLLRQKEKTVEQIVKYEKIYIEKNQVEQDLMALKKQYEELETHDANLQKEIEEKKAYIDQLLKEAEKHRGDAYVIAKLKKETETLREIMKHYVRTIDSLNTLNQNLVAEKKQVLKKLDEEKEKQKELEKEKEELKKTIKKGSVLSCFGITAKAYQLKRGGSKESETAKARKTDRIKVSFTLGENKIAKAEEKVIYVRIMTPDGKELAKSYDEAYRFKFNDSYGYYAGKTFINYANKEMQVVVNCDGKEGDFVPGNYIIEVTCDEAVIGTTTLKLD
jgi:DNA repair exonuclease SbcCD ATPase subunit